MLSYRNFYLILIACLYYYKREIIEPTNKVVDTPLSDIKDEYDFIIVGAGSAGCVMAARLSEMKNVSVLLIEAGGDQTLESDVPLLSIIGSDADWKYKSKAQTRACLAIGGQCEMPRGKVLGGSSSLNALVYLRGNPKDYDDWEAQGNYGWGWPRSRLYFAYSENNTNKHYVKDTENHGSSGPLTVSENNFRSKISDAYLKGGEQMGFKIKDVNGFSRTGFMRYQGTTNNGIRMSTNRAFLRPASHRKNLNVAMHAYVNKILFDGTKAVGVVFEKNFDTKTVKAKKEIILSSGTIGSAQLLMVSGVGPKEILHPLGIPVLADLPVGKHLQDHLGVGLSFKVHKGNAINFEDYMNPKSILDYSLDMKGPLSVPYGVEAVAYLNATEQERKDDYPDIELVISSFSGPDKDEVRPGGFHLRPKSIGQLTIVSKDPKVHPLIDPNYLNVKSDLDVMVQLVKYIIELGETPAMKAHGATLNKNGVPRCKEDMHSREFAECVIKYYSSSLHHQVGTCRMHKDGVVDPELRIHGMQNIRVVDGSIMPTIISSNTNAAIIMIAETAADIIKRHYGHPPNVKS